ncbi:MAG TPA: TetR/AcrR family transcriptional regulator [Ktedonobacterales bacterium]|nr:TetR/AcrR family transcriptional regulator [Ktedonobacterales bacterium]
MAARNSRDAGIDENSTEDAPAHIAPLVPVTARGEATRRRILDAAEDVFGEMGYYEASVSEITRRAGVAQGTFYIYFHSKRETFVELIEDIGERLRAVTSAASQDAPNRIEAERRGFAAFFRFVYEHRRIYRIVEDAGRVAPEAAREYYRRISVGYEHALRAAMRAGQIRETNEEAIGYALMGIAHFLALRWIIWPAEGEAGQEQLAGQPPATVIPEAIFDAVFTFIARGLSPESEK